jgi:curved DNA-binding protein CbpA
MATLSIEAMPLANLYLQIEYGESPLAVFGVNHDDTVDEVRNAYHTLARRIHPDRVTGDELRELHTLLFQKVQHAYDAILKDRLDQRDDNSYVIPKRLPETVEALHARNVAFREELRSERERALKLKNTADARHAAKQAKLQARNKSLAEQREAHLHEQAQKLEKRQAGIYNRSEQTAKRIDRTLGRHREYVEHLQAARARPLLDWEQEEDRLELADQSSAEKKKQTSRSRPPPPPQNKPTARTAQPMWDYRTDERLVSEKEINARWDKNLLSGGLQGSVSLSQKKQKASGAATRAQKYTSALCEEADDMIKGALKGNRTFSALAHDQLDEEAFVGAEARAEARTDQVMRLTNGDVVGQYFLENGDEGRSLPLDLLTIAEG